MSDKEWREYTLPSGLSVRVKPGYGVVEIRWPKREDWLTFSTTAEATRDVIYVLSVAIKRPRDE